MPQTPTYKTLYSFRGTPREGARPEGGLILGASGLLYGTTSGPPADDGTVYAMNRHSGPETVLYRFKGGVDGSAPVAGLYQDAKGLLYGTTYVGGSFGQGTVFRLDPVSHVKTKLHDFRGKSDGAYPVSSLVPGVGSLTFGVTQSGGRNCSVCGIIYSVDTVTGAVAPVRGFNAIDAAAPNSGLTQGQPGIFYGPSSSSGVNGQGSIYALDVARRSIKLVYSFTGQSDGGNPEGTLAYDSATKTLYGNTVTRNGAGTIFGLDTRTGVLSTLYTFTLGIDGYFPFSGLTLSHGMLYGTTENGGAGYAGTIFSFNPVTRTLTTLYAFSGISGSSHLLAVERSLFGTTVNCGPADVGTIFKETP